jgi:hypothetical protein
MKFSDLFQRKKAAATYHTDYTGVNIARGLELSQKARGDLFTPREYSELEAVSLLAVYMVHINVTGIVNDEALQARLVERARKMAEEKLGIPLDAETTD